MVLRRAPTVNQRQFGGSDQNFLRHQAELHCHRGDRGRVRGVLGR
jgi:hypothetical protein